MMVSLVFVVVLVNVVGIEFEFIESRLVVGGFSDGDVVKSVEKNVNGPRVGVVSGTSVDVAMKLLSVLGVEVWSFSVGVATIVWVTMSVSTEPCGELIDGSSEHQ